MPYLDLTDLENFVHLVQLFYAAHADSQQEHEQLRAQTGKPGEYFLSPPLVRELVSWARQQHLLTREDAHRLLDVARHVTEEPGQVFPLTLRLMGEPPRLQPTVLASEIDAWVYLEDVAKQDRTEDSVFTLTGAMQFLDQVITDSTILPAIRARAQLLWDWLAVQATV